MFAIKNNQVAIMTMANYSYNNGAFNIYYDKPDEFIASLDIILDQTAGKFGALSFSFRNEAGATSTLLMSVANIDDIVNLYLSNNNGNSFAIRISEVQPIIREIAAQCIEIFHLRQKSAPYFDNQELVNQAKQLLISFITLGKRSLEISDMNKVPEVLIKISHILNLEIEKFKSVIEINEIKTSSPSP